MIPVFPLPSIVFCQALFQIVAADKLGEMSGKEKEYLWTEKSKTF